MMRSQPMHYNYVRNLREDVAMSIAKELVQIQSDLMTVALPAAFRIARSSVEPPERFALNVLQAQKTKIALKNSRVGSFFQDNPIGALATLKMCMELIQEPLTAKITGVEAVNESKHSSYDSGGALIIKLGITALEVGTTNAAKTVEDLSGFSDIRVHEPQILLGFGCMDYLPELVLHAQLMLSAANLTEIPYDGVVAIPNN